MGTDKRNLSSMRVVEMEYSNCYQSQLSTIAYWWLEPKNRISIEICGMGSWNFRFHKNGLLGESVDFQINQPKYLKEFYGIEVYSLYLTEVAQKLAFIEKEIDAGRPLLIRMNSSFVSWDPNPFNKEDAYHLVIINGYNKDKREFSVVDAFYKMEDVTISYEAVEQGMMDKILAFRFYEHSKDYADENWKMYLQEALNILVDEQHSSFSEMTEFANEFSDIEAVKAEMESEEDYVGSQLYQKIIGLINGRQQFAAFIRYLCDKVQIEKLYELVTCMEIASEMWHKVQLKLVKIHIMKKYKKLDSIREQILKIRDYEENLYSEFEKLISEENVLDRQRIELNWFKQISILDYCNNKAFDKPSMESKADVFFLEDIPSCELTEYMKGTQYLDKDKFPEGKKLLYNNYEFDFSKQLESEYDNISCEGQVIEIDCPNVDTIIVIGCATLMTFIEDIQVNFTDGTSINEKFGFTVWWKKPLLGEKIIWEASGIVCVDGNMSVSNNRRYLYLTHINIPKGKQLQSIQLPNCRNLHIFSLALGGYETTKSLC